MAMPRKDAPVPRWSNQEYWRTAESVPTRKARTAARRKEAPMSSSVAGSRSRIISETGRVVEKLMPRSPRAAAPIQRTYWTCTGWSTPRRARYASMTSGSMKRPDSRRAPSGPRAPPGSRRRGPR